MKDQGINIIKISSVDDFYGALLRFSREHPECLVAQSFESASSSMVVLETPGEADTTILSDVRYLMTQIIQDGKSRGSIEYDGKIYLRQLAARIETAKEDEQKAQILKRRATREHYIKIGTFAIAIVALLLSALSLGINLWRTSDISSLRADIENVKAKQATAQP